MVIYVWKLLPTCKQTYTFNSQPKITEFVLSLFADDTTVIGSNQEITMGIEIIEEVMENFEVQTNKSKEEHAICGNSESGNVRMLGTRLER